MKLVFTISFLMILINCAVAQPSWCRDEPVSSSGKYCYICVHVRGNEDVLEKSLKNAASCLGLTGYNYRQISGAGDGGTIEVGEKTLNYKRIRAKNESHSSYVLMMFSTGDKNLPRHATRNPLYLTFPMSAAIPGTGQMYKKQGGKGALMLVGFLGAAGSAAYFELDRRNDLNAFEKATTFDERESLLRSMDQSMSFRNISLGVAGAVYLINIVDVMASKSKRYALNDNNKFDWNLAYHPQAKAPVLGLTFSIGPKI